METEKYPMGRHPNSLEALKKHGYKPGKSGNPRGRPKETRYLSEALRELLQDPREVRAIAQRILKDAKAGNYNAINLLAERTEGKVTQPIRAEGDTKITFTIGKGYDEGSRTEVSTDQPNPK